ncbi:MAG: ChbG/HpnK family deacetylase [Phycisphaerae bacterium]|nr:ChbG/HpnK family deacetylase [Phycisphaerae bacterium]
MRRWLSMTVVLVGLVVLRVHAQDAGPGSRPNQSVAQQLGFRIDERLLIIHADDAGMCHAVNLGTIEATSKGIVNSASVMTPCAWFPEMAAYCRDHPQLDTGVHATLTSEWKYYRWRPVSPHDKVPGLLDSEGFLWPDVRGAAQSGRAEEVEQELRAQVQRALAFGIKPTHLDTHMGTVFSRPDFFQAYRKVANEFKLPYLLPRLAPDRLGKMNPAIRATAVALQKLMESSGELTLDDLVSIEGDVPPRDQKRFYLDAIRCLRPGITQIIIHVGIESPELAATTSMHARRDMDRQVFMDPEVKQVIEAEKVRLITWREIGERQRRFLGLHGGPSTAPAAIPGGVEARPGPEHERGVVKASQIRPMKSESDPRLAVLLKRYEEPPGDVPWAMDRISTMPSCDIYDLQFPSPVITATPENNTVWCEYYRCRGEAKRPAVIVLHILDGRFRESRLICHYLAARGIDCMMLKMAYYGPRRPKDPERVRAFTQDIDTVCEAVRQSAMDARRAARWLESRPCVNASQISILGTSLGGFVASVASGVDGRFAHSVLILTGGDLPTVLTTNEKEVAAARRAFEASGMTRKDLVRRLELVEPLTFASRIDGKTVLMINTREDPIVPPTSARALAKAIGGVRHLWYPGDHYAIIYRVFEILDRVARYLTDSPQADSRSGGM